MQLAFDAWTSDSIVVNYFDNPLLEVSRQADLSFITRDYCLGATYSLPTLELLDPGSVYSYNNQTGQLQIVKEILSGVTVFYLGYPTYV